MSIRRRIESVQIEDVGPEDEAYGEDVLPTDSVLLMEDVKDPLRTTYKYGGKANIMETPLRIKSEPTSVLNIVQLFLLAKKKLCNSIQLFPNNFGERMVEAERSVKSADTEIYRESLQKVRKLADDYAKGCDSFIQQVEGSDPNNDLEIVTLIPGLSDEVAGTLKNTKNNVKWLKSALEFIGRFQDDYGYKTVVDLNSINAMISLLNTKLLDDEAYLDNARIALLNIVNTYKRKLQTLEQYEVDNLNRVINGQQTPDFITEQVLTKLDLKPENVSGESKYVPLTQSPWLDPMVKREPPLSSGSGELSTVKPLSAETMQDYVYGSPPSTSKSPPIVVPNPFAEGRGVFLSKYEPVMADKSTAPALSYTNFPGLASIPSPVTQETKPSMELSLGSVKPLVYQSNLSSTPVLALGGDQTQPSSAITAAQAATQPQASIATKFEGTTLPIKQTENGPDPTPLISTLVPRTVSPAENPPSSTVSGEPGQVFVVPPAAPLPYALSGSPAELVAYNYPGLQFKNSSPTRLDLYGDADPSDYSFPRQTIDDEPSSLYDPVENFKGAADVRLETKEYWDPTVVGADRITLAKIRDGRGSWFKVPELLALTSNTAFTSGDLMNIVKSTVGPESINTVTNTEGELIPVVSVEALAMLLKNSPDTCPTRDVCISTIKRCLESSLDTSGWSSNTREGRSMPSVDFAIPRANLAINVDDEAVDRRPTTRLEMANNNLKVLEYNAGRPLGLFLTFLGKVCNQVLQNYNGPVMALEPALS